MASQGVFSFGDQAMLYCIGLYELEFPPPFNVDDLPAPFYWCQITKTKHFQYETKYLFYNLMCSFLLTQTFPY
ncbi:hypothetical protein GDO86_007199 [Hymenochirus boettgeri]|uniref:Uncharacterized protein n=1 Tax=Hymenochirus boettgeri TaxID=247094 RepID=A0A8T2IY76_9PIPI|nr:hypothetical protein GDO86_007199 [Hymenochirus boettgeri]